jgi:hypothetical protein
MLKVFLSYARADGAGAGETLRQQVTQMGFTVWQDTEQMRGGQPWQGQLDHALRQVDALLALLTPGYLASPVCTWEWQTARTLGKRVIPLLSLPCDLPDELAQLQYHDLSDPARYPLGLAKLARDLVELIPTAPPPAPASGSKYYIVGNRNQMIGEGATVVTVSGANANALLKNILPALAQLRAGAGPHQPEFDVTLREISARLAAVEQGVAGVQVSVQAVHGDLKTVGTLVQQILARFDKQEQQLLVPILARMDEHHLAQLDAILAAMETTAVAADELDRLLAAISETLAVILAGQRLPPAEPLRQRLQQALDAAGNETLDRRHRLKLTVPIIPLLLAYEAEVEVGVQSRLAGLWQSLKNLFG